MNFLPSGFLNWKVALNLGRDKTKLVSLIWSQLALPSGMQVCSPGLIESIIRLERYSKEVAVGLDVVRQFGAAVSRNFPVHRFVVAELNVIARCVRGASGGRQVVDQF